MEMQLPTPEGLYTLSTVFQEPSRQLDSVLDLLLPHPWTDCILLLGH